MSNEVVIVMGVIVAVLFGIALLVIVQSRVRVDTGHALVITKLGSARTVTFTDALVLPIVHRSDLVDLSVKRIVVWRYGKEGVICGDNIRADVKVAFTIRVNRTVDDVLRVVETIGANRASDADTLDALFAAKFSEALKTVAAKLDFAELYTKREELKDRVIEVIGRDLNGYVLDDAAIDYIEQTPIEMLDPNNVLDALGIEKIRKVTSSARTATARRVDMPGPEATFATRLAEQGLLDIGIATEVAASTAIDRTLKGRVKTHRDKLTRLVAPAILEALADAELACANGTVTVRFDTYATEQQVLYAARLVHALKQDASIFR